MTTSKAARPETLPETDEWYVARSQKQQGPFTYSRLQQLARSGRLRATDMLWQEGFANWIPATSIDGLIPTPTPPVRTPVPVPLQPKAEWFERGIPICFEPVEGVFCQECVSEVRFVEVHGDHTVTCPGCGKSRRLDPGFLAGGEWQSHVREVKAMLEQWTRGGSREGGFPEGAFAELKRQHERTLETAMQCYQTLHQLLAIPGSAPSQIDHARQQLARWHGQATKLHEDRRRAIQQMKRAAAGRMMRPGTRLVFADDDVRSVLETTIPPPGSPERDGYDVIGEEHDHYPGEGSQSPFDHLDHTGDSGYQPRRAKSGAARWLVIGSILALFIVLLPIAMFVVFFSATPPPADVGHDGPALTKGSRGKNADTPHNPKDFSPKREKGSAPPKVAWSALSEAEAKAKLEIALDSWVLKESPEEFRRSNPEITFADVDRAFSSLQRYEIIAAARKSEDMWDVSVRGAYANNVSGEETRKTTTYTVWKKSGHEWRIVPTR